MEHYISLFVKAVFVENMALAFFLGMCTFLAVSKTVKTAVGLGIAVIVIQTITASVFNSTNLDRVLRNIGCDSIVMAGVVTNGCIESTVRDAADLSYNVVLVEDACGALSEDLHTSALRTLRHSYCTPVATREVVKAVRSG